jgi:uncharacterized protein YcbX
MTAVLAGIRVFPIKALDALVLHECALLPGGALAGDRRFAMLDADGNCVNGKRHPGVHAIRARYSLTADAVVLSAPDRPERAFPLAGDLAPLEDWLAGALGQPIRLGRDDERGFPDDRKASGPTVVSTASLEEVARWFPEIALESVRRRFRANLEIAGVPPFWEDRLFGAADTTVSFRIGGAVLAGSNPCARCAVPPRDPDTGEILGGFQRRFSDRRRETLPAWADASRFDHFYRFTVNTVAPGHGVRMLRTGDPVTLV